MASARVVGENHRCRRVLFVESDDTDARRILHQIPSSALLVKRVRSPKQALRKLVDDGPFDLVLLSLPSAAGDVGVQFEDLLRETDLPIVLLGRNGHDRACKDALRRGAEEYLHKQDLLSDELVHSVQRAIERNRIAHEMRIQRGALEATGTGVVLLRPERNGLKHPIHYCNSAFEQMVGHSREDVLGEDMVRFLGRHAGVSTAELERALAEGKATDPLRFIKPDGEVVWLEWTATKLEDDGASGGEWVCAFNDITERQLTWEKIRQSQRLESVGQLAGGIAHDFNNLLTVVLGDAELLSGELKGASQLERLERIRAAAERASRLTQQLLAFSRQQPLELVTLDVNNVVDELEGMIRRLLNEQIEFRCNAPLEPCWVLADRGQIEQVLVNLVVNASDAMPDGGTLLIETTRVSVSEADMERDLDPGEYVRLSIEDTGEGMDETTSERVFEPFFTTKETGRGTGLGLATVYGIIRQLGGQVHVESQLGLGSRFELFLPTERGPAVVETKSEQLEMDFTGNETVLVVEDDEGVRSMATDMLFAQGYRVVPMDSPLEALRWARADESCVHLLLTDVVMPDMSGPDLAEALCTIKPGLRVVMMTGYADDKALDGEELSHAALIHKPFTTSELSRTIRESLR